MAATFDPAANSAAPRACTTCTVVIPATCHVCIACGSQQPVRRKWRQKRRANSRQTVAVVVQLIHVLSSGKHLVLVTLQHQARGRMPVPADATTCVDPEAAPDEPFGALSSVTVVGETVRLPQVGQESVASAHASSGAALETATKLSDSAIVAELKDPPARGIPVSLGQLILMRRSEAGLPTAGPLEGECPICMSDLADEASVYLFPGCAHVHCTECMMALVRDAVLSNSLHRLACCFSDDCTSLMPTADVKLLVELANDATLRERFLALLADSVPTAMGATITCPNCTRRSILEDGSPKVDCRGCSQQFCRHCPGNPVWHDGSTCKQFQSWMRNSHPADAALEAMLNDVKSRIKSCPKCRSPIFKPLRANGGGDNHIRCCCGCDFCFLCGAAFSMPFYQAHYNEEGPCKGKLYWDDPESV